MDDFDPNPPRERTLTINGQEFELECRDPYGFWYLMGSNIPNELKQTFTSLPAAERAITQYLSRKNKPEAPKTIVSTDGKGNKKRIPQDSTIEG